MTRVVPALAVCAWSLVAPLPARGAPIALNDERESAIEGIRRAPLDAESFAELAVALFHNGDIPHAVAAAEEAARLAPTAARHQRVLGYLHAANGAERDAEVAFRRAAEIEPTGRIALADFHLALAGAEYQDALRHGPPDAAAAERLRGIAALGDLSPELQLLLRATQKTSRPVAEVVPPVLLLSDEARYALVVDKRTQTARLYGRSGRDDLVLLQTYPCTTGREPGTKNRRGDWRTPDGVYVITDLVAGDQLPDAYGGLALPLSYPNAWDRRERRDGTGIWLHGSDRLSAPFNPRETRGCVLLRNDDLRDLARLIAPGVTPVLIAEDMPYRPTAEWRVMAQELLERAPAANLLAVVATPDYAVVMHRDGTAIVRDFVSPTSPRKIVTSERMQPIAAAVWGEKLAALAPSAPAALLSVRVLDEPNAPSIVIETSGPASARDFRREQSDRLYVDLPGVRPGPMPSVIGGTGPLVQEVRVASTGLDPPSTRLVIALRQPVDYRIDTEGNRIVVSFKAQ